LIIAQNTPIYSEHSRLHGEFIELTANASQPDEWIAYAFALQLIRFVIGRGAESVVGVFALHDSSMAELRRMADSF
jgi:hypothetical protein